MREALSVLRGSVSGPDVPGARRSALARLVHRVIPTCGKATSRLRDLSTEELVRRYCEPWGYTYEHDADCTDEADPYADRP